jgi:DNA-binding NarL/FixJ family response regulator
MSGGKLRVDEVDPVKIRVLLVDDQTIVRRGLKALLKLETTIEIVAEAADGEEAIAIIPQVSPAVILMDVRMPVMDGVAATETIVREFPEVKVLILTTFDDREYVTQAMHYGAAGYLLKDTPLEELVAAIHAVAKGYTQLAPGLVQKLMTPPTPSESTPIALADLTPREREILASIAAGASNREIAQNLYISEKTVKNHITNILNRLGLRDRTQAAIFFHKANE